MVTHLARAKRPGPKEIKEQRDTNWSRVGTIIYGLKRPTQVDIWFARKFLRFVICNPIVHSGDKMADEGPLARQHLELLDKRFPEKKHKTKVNQQGKSKSPAHIKIIRKTLYRVRKDIRTLRPKSEWWERKLLRTPISDKKWMQIRDTTHQIREQLKQLELQAERLKGAL